MKVVIIGATGLIGGALCKKLYPDYEITALSRHPEKSRLGQNIKVAQWDGKSPGRWTRYVEEADAVVNLAGENIASGRWTKVKEQRILESRLNSTKAIVDAIASAKNKPRVLVQASATGFYGSCGDKEIDENAGKGTGFLAEVCEQWEQAAKPVEAAGTRLVIIRTGVVLSRDGGALPRMVKPFKFFLGGYPGTGRQWVSWISIEDEVAAIRFLMENNGLSGPFNLTAPAALTMKFFCQTIGRILQRPCWLPVPALALRAALGKMADEIILNGQKVMPKRLMNAGFKFGYPTINEALKLSLTERISDEYS
jgi:uncharacterized protein (TIGR01777 family)